MTEHFIRHGEYLTLASIVDDPVYLEEPFIRTSQFVHGSNLTLDQRFIFEVVDEVADRPRGRVPAYSLGITEHRERGKHAYPLPEATAGRAREID